MPDDQKYYTCDGCKMLYDTDARKPLLLPCGHVCCRSCASSMEDRSDTVCLHKNCKQDWGGKSLSDLKMVYDLIPGKSGSKAREVTPAPTNAGACGAAAAAAPVPLVGTGREVEPMEEDDDRDDAASTSSGERRQISVTECPVCLEDYNGNESRPVLLTCGHASCLSCLELLEKEARVTCPRCRKMWPKGALRNLPVVKSLVRPNNWNKKNAHKNITPFSACKRTKELEMEWRQNEGASNEEKVEVVIQSGVTTRTVHANLEHDTMDDLMRDIPGGACSSRRFSANGRTMQNNRPLADYNVQPRGTIYETPRLTGGSQF